MLFCLRASSLREYPLSQPAPRLEPGGDAVTLRVEKLEVEAPMAKEFTVTLTLRGRPEADNYTAVELLY